jgi:ABC-type multidrug transport system ATPase subunit
LSADCRDSGFAVQLMGPSGSGKTSLLNALARHTPVTKGMTLSGRLHVNGAEPDDAGVRIGYVQQEDLFYSQVRSDTIQSLLESCRTHITTFCAYLQSQHS